MKRAITSVTLILVALIVLVTLAKAEPPKEGTISYTYYLGGTAKWLRMGPLERVIYEHNGEIAGETDEDILHNASCRCLGEKRSGIEECNESGFCVSTRPDGDQIFWTFHGTSEECSRSKGTYSLVGGTGKFAGIEGSGEYVSTSIRFSQGSPNEGTFQACTTGKGHYKLP
jgi:hypothetical protein